MPPDDLHLTNRLYDELRQVAGRIRWRFRDLPLQTTEVVHETYLRLAAREGATVVDRGHYLALAARSMRFYLLDEARRLRAAERRVGRTVPKPQDEIADPRMEFDGVLAVLTAVDRLKKIDPDAGEVVELHVLGLRQPEIAAAIARSTRTARTRLRKGQALLAKLLDEDGAAVTMRWPTGDDDDGSPATGTPADR